MSSSSGQQAGSFPGFAYPDAAGLRRQINGISRFPLIIIGFIFELLKMIALLSGAAVQIGLPGSQPQCI